MITDNISFYILCGLFSFNFLLTLFLWTKIISVGEVHDRNLEFFIKEFRTIDENTGELTKEQDRQNAQLNILYDRIIDLLKIKLGDK